MNVNLIKKISLSSMLVEALFSREKNNYIKLLNVDLDYTFLIVVCTTCRFD